MLELSKRLNLGVINIMVPRQMLELPKRLNLGVINIMVPRQMLELPKRLNLGVINIMVPRQMLELPVRVHHDPEDIEVMIDDYFTSFLISFSTSSNTFGYSE